MEGLPILSIITFLPVVGALLILLVRGSDKTARLIALATTAVDFVLSLVLWANFDPSTADFQFLESSVWLGGNISIITPYVVMLLVLLVRPYGLFGTREVERV